MQSPRTDLADESFQLLQVPTDAEVLEEWHEHNEQTQRRLHALRQLHEIQAAAGEAASGRREGSVGPGLEGQQVEVEAGQKQGQREGPAGEEGGEQDRMEQQGDEARCVLAGLLVW